MEKGNIKAYVKEIKKNSNEPSTRFSNSSSELIHTDLDSQNVLEDKKKKVRKIELRIINNDTVHVNTT